MAHKHIHMPYTHTHTHSHTHTYTIKAYHIVCFTCRIHYCCYCGKELNKDDWKSHFNLNDGSNTNNNDQNKCPFNENNDSNDQTQTIIDQTNQQPSMYSINNSLFLFLIFFLFVCFFFVFF